MYKSSFGTIGQITFQSENEYYELLGFLCQNKKTQLVWEENNEQGAWGQEGRILFLVDYNPIPLRAKMKHTAGNLGSESRVNCNEFVENIVINHKFVLGKIQNALDVRATVPKQFIADFDNGLNL